MLQALLQAHGDDQIGEAVMANRQHYSDGSEPYPGMRQAGLRIYLATSKREVFARRIMETLKLATYFDGIYGSVPGGKLDHKPELLARLLSDSLIFGDRRMTSSELTRSICHFADEANLARRGLV